MYSSLRNKNADLEEPESISEFEIDEVSQLNKLMSLTTLEEKENEKHTTDRFIPLRKHSAIEVGTCFPMIEEENELSLRGKEIKEEKMTVDQMYRCVLLDKNASKMFNFGGSNPEKQPMSLLKKVGRKAEPKFFKEENYLI